jgi:hypothetical protein
MRYCHHNVITVIVFVVAIVDEIKYAFAYDLRMELIELF